VSEAGLDDAHQDSHQERHEGGGHRRIELITGEAAGDPTCSRNRSLRASAG
jgi:hypothetical protein